MLHRAAWQGDYSPSLGSPSPLSAIEIALNDWNILNDWNVWNGLVPVGSCWRRLNLSCLVNRSILETQLSRVWTLRILIPRFSAFPEIPKVKTRYQIILHRSFSRRL